MKHTLNTLIEAYRDELNSHNALLIKGVVVVEGNRECYCALYRVGDQLALQEEEGYATVVWPEQYYEVVGLMFRSQALNILNPPVKKDDTL